MTHRFFDRPFAEAPEVAPSPSAPPAPESDAVGYGCPPTATRFQPGRSGNPQGRPRRPKPAAHAGRSDLERALATQVACEIGGKVRQVSVIRMVVARLTEKAMAGDVVACRELARLWCDADAARAAREAAAERVAADLSSAASAKDARDQREAEQAEERSDFAASIEIADLAEAAAVAAGEREMEPADRALKLLDAAEFEDGRPVRLKPWVVGVAAAYGPDDALAGDGPPDLQDVDGTLERLGVAADDDLGDLGLADWFIDAARARQGQPPLPLGDAALLELVRVEEDAPDWRGRLARLVAAGPH